MSQAAQRYADVPIRPAATVMLVADRPDLHVLLLRRRLASDFVGGMSVFPGGGVDAEDAAPEVAALADGLDASLASRRLDLQENALAHWVAVVRETFEEAGVLLARRPGAGAVVALDDRTTRSRFARHRAEVDAGRALLAEILAVEDLRLATDAIHYTARWITPPGSPRRYDTRFFLAAAPAGQEASADETEAVDARWTRPADALERFSAGELLMLPPTAAMLRILSGFSSAAEAVAEARRCEDAPDLVARVSGRGDTRHWEVVLPDDEDYERVAHDGSLGWVRMLSPRECRSSVRGPGLAD